MATVTTNQGAMQGFISVIGSGAAFNTVLK
jgi:hypothetical protein